MKECLEVWKRMKIIWDKFQEKSDKSNNKQKGLSNTKTKPSAPPLVVAVQAACKVLNLPLGMPSTHVSSLYPALPDGNSTHSESESSATFLLYWERKLFRYIFQICNSLPDPKNAHAFVDALKRTTCYAQLMGPDFRTILKCCLKNQFSEEDLISEVPALKTENKVNPNSNAEGDPFYFWSVLDNLKTFYKDLCTFMLSRNISQRDLMHASNCKQHPQELCSAYLRRFNMSWTEHAGLGTDHDAGILFILTFLTNMIPEHTQALRLTTPKQMQKTPQDLTK